MKTESSRTGQRNGRMNEQLLALLELLLELKIKGLVLPAAKINYR
mgnify:CR=1 FL=1